MPEERSPELSPVWPRDGAIIKRSLVLPGGGQPPNGVRPVRPFQVHDLAPEAEEQLWDIYEFIHPSTRCVNYRREGHTVAQCVIPRPDRLVYSCVFCNTVRHDMGSCRFLHDEDGLIDVLVRGGANMPQLSTVEWYRIYSIYVNNNPGIPVEEAFPWTTTFGQETLHDTSLGIQARNVLMTFDRYRYVLRPHSL
ncbi:hypothetical protein DER45DRAFT_541701 [Fusarium avenaceum]|nr:hypothetical protein DER45DRAFT_541701 [Fusarium avenaceum]